MRRRSERKKTPEVSMSPAPTARRSRRSRKTASPSPEKSDHDSSAEKDEIVQTPRSRRRTSSTASKDHSPVKKGRIELTNIVEENGEEENINKGEEIEKSIEENEGVKSRKLSDDKKPAKEQPAEENESNIKEKKVRQTDKNLDDIERTTEIQTPKESKDSEKPLEKDDKSSSKRKHSKELEKSPSSSERSHRKDKDLKIRRKSVEVESNEDNSAVSQINSSVVETNGDKEIELSEQVGPTIEDPPVLDTSTKKVDIDKQKTVKKRKWASRKSSEHKIMAISTDSLKSLIADPVHPVPLSDVNLDSSPEIEVVQSETEAHHEETDQAQFNKKERESNRKSPEKTRPSKEELEEGEDDSEEEEGQIERENPAVKTNSSPILYITNLVRPFTIMQLKGLLARTGKIVENGFWIDRIKSKCFVKFDNEDQAIETRHALHGVRWPTSNPKCLNVEFGTEDAMSVVLASMEETPKFGSENTKENRLVGIGWDGNGFEEERKVVRQVREWDMGKREEFQKERIRDRNQDERKEQKEVDKRNPFRDSEKEEERRGGRDRRHRSPSYDKHRRSRSISPVRKIKKDNEPPLRLLDDLFRKTKIAPCVYWLPLTPEQIVEKEQRRLKRIQEVEEHRREREKREKEREKQRETEREQRRNNRNRSGDRDRIRERSRDDRRRSRSRDRRRY